MFLLLFVVKICAQSPIINIYHWNGQAPINSYVKDVNNIFDPFEGTWLYRSSTMSLKIVLVKKIMDFNGIYYKDIMIGEYEFYQNGDLIKSTLLQLNTFTNPFLHSIVGNYIPTTPTPFPEGTDSEIRIQLRMRENVSCTLNFRKALINGKVALQMLKRSTPSSARYNEIQEQPFIQDAYYNLFKQN